MKIIFHKKSNSVAIQDIPFTYREVKKKFKEFISVSKYLWHPYPEKVFGKNFEIDVGRTRFFCFERNQNTLQNKPSILALFSFGKRDVNKVLKILFPKKKELILELI